MDNRAAFRLSPLYVIADAEVLAARAVPLQHFAEELRAAGVTLLQYRDKSGSPQHILHNAALLRETFAGTNATLILNDRPDLALLADLHGAHVGQQDLSPADARLILGPDRIVGVSTHNESQLHAADATSADYLAIGPVFPTSTKLNPDPVVGLEGLRRARTFTTKPLVAIGGITRDNTRSVLDAGANSIAVISALFAPGESIEKVARDFLSLLR